MHCQNRYFKTRLFENPVPMLLRMQPRSVTVDKESGIFTKRIWQPYLSDMVNVICYACV